jgi:hypothetical protein
MNMEYVWVFNVERSNFPGGIFSTRDGAEQWIRHHRLNGTLTRYPVDRGVYEWAIAGGLFTPKKPHHTEPEFIGGFTTASMEHYHYDGGDRTC